MKVLTRRIGESLIVDDDIEIQIIGIYGDRIRFKISLPEHASLEADEVLRRFASLWSDKH